MSTPRPKLDIDRTRERLIQLGCLHADDQLEISDAHEGAKATAAAKVLKTTCWQRCRVHFMRNALAHVPMGQRAMVAALLRTIFVYDLKTDARRQWRTLTD